MNYYERHLGDYAKDAGHLTMLEHGAYTLLLDRYYTTDAPIPADQAHRLCRARSAEEVAAVDVVLAEFFVLVDGHWINRRADQEIVKAAQRIEAAKANGKKGGRPKANPNPSETQWVSSGLGLGYPAETQVEAHHAPSNHLTTEAKAKATVQQAAPQAGGPDSLIGAIRSPDGPAPRKPKQTAARFPEFWAAYPVKKGRAAAERHWRTQGLDPMADQIIAHVRLMEAEDDQWQRGFIKHGSAYINGKGWEDEPVKAPLDRNVKAHAPPPPPESFGAKAALQRSESKLENALAYIRQQHGRGEFGEGEAGAAEFNRRMAEATAKYRGT